jgi:hypothetical protein
VTAASGLEEVARAKQAVRERVWPSWRASEWPASRAPRDESPTSPARRRPPLGSPRSRRGGRPAWSRPTPTLPSSWSGHKPWPTASSCTWPSPAWPTNAPSSSSTQAGSRSPTPPGRLHQRVGARRAADPPGRAATRGPGGLRQRGRQPRGRPMSVAGRSRTNLHRARLKDVETRAATSRRKESTSPRSTPFMAE